MKLGAFLLLACPVLAAAQTPLAPIWSRPSHTQVKDIAYCAATNRIAVLSATHMSVFNRGSATELWHIPILANPGENSVNDVIFTRDGQLVIVGGGSFRPRIYNANTGAFLRYLSSDTGVAGEPVLGPANPTSGAYPAGADIFVAQLGFFRLSDGALLRSSPLPTTDDSRFTVDGYLLSTGIGIARSDHSESQDASGGTNPPTQVGPTTSRFITAASDDGGYYAVVRQTRFDELDRAIPYDIGKVYYPPTFNPVHLRPLGDSSRYVCFGSETSPTNGQAMCAAVVIDFSTFRILDHKVFSFAVTGPQPFEMESDFGFLFSTYADNRDTLVEVPVSSTGRLGTPTTISDNPFASGQIAAGPNGDGLVAESGTMNQTMDLIDGATGGSVRRIADAVHPNSPYFAFSPSGKYVYYQSYDGGFSTATTPAGYVVNKASDFAPASLFPLADDTLLGHFGLPDLTLLDARVTRSAPTYKVFKTYTPSEYMIGASTDKSTFLTDYGGQIRLRSVSSGAQIGYSTWTPANHTQEELQTAVEGDGFVVVAKKIVDPSTSHIFLDVRRYAHQGSILSPISTAVRRTYAMYRTFNGVETQMDMHFRLSPDGRAVWVNYQGIGRNIDFGNHWLGEWIRTADGAVLSQNNDPAYDTGVDATGIDPLNRRGYITRYTGELEAVPLPNAMGTVLPATPEVVGGLRSSAIFRLLRASDETRSYTAVPAGLTLDSTNVHFDPGARDVSIGFMTEPVDVATDATIKVTDGFGTVSGKVHVIPARILGAAFAGASVQGGQSIDLTLTLDGPAGPSGRTITLTDNSSYLLTPASAVVPPGATSVTITIPTKPISKNATVTLTAKLDSKSAKAAITILH